MDSFAGFEESSVKSKACSWPKEANAVLDLLELLPCRFLAATPEWLDCPSEVFVRANEKVEATMPMKSERPVCLKNPQEVLAVFEIPSYEMNPELRYKVKPKLGTGQHSGPGQFRYHFAHRRLVRHPKQVVCSIGTVDAFNPKTVQATMGAIGRIHLHYTDLAYLFWLNCPFARLRYLFGWKKSCIKPICKMRASL